MGKSLNITERLAVETKKKVLVTIRDSQGISRLEVAKKTGFSNATVSRCVESLINDEGLVLERGNRNIPKGRPRKLLYFNGENKYVIGIDLGTTYIRGVLSDCNVRVIKEVELVTEVEKGPLFVISKVVDIIHRLSETEVVERERIKGVGIAVAGLINSSSHLVEYSPAFEWRNIDFKRLLEEKVDLPIFYDNVSRVMALGEHTFGVGSRYRNFIMVNVGHGIGAGIVLNGSVFKGAHGMAGELGHVPMFGDGEVRCSCGRVNCLTSYASGYAIAKRMAIRISEGGETILSPLGKMGEVQLTTEMVAKAAIQGDGLANEVFGQGVKYLGAAISGLINILNPEAVFVGGGVSLNGPIFWDTLKISIKENGLEESLGKASVLPVTFPGRTAIYGAMALVLEQVLDLRI